MKQNSLFAEVLSTVTKCFIVLVALVIIGIACSGIRIVETGNVALLLRFGKLVGDTPEEQIHQPGLLLAFPYIIDEVITVPTGSIIQQSVTTYYTDAETRTKDGAYVITGDQNVAVMSASVKYVISDPVAYALNVANASDVINACVSTAMLSEAAATDVDDLLTTGKDRFTSRVLSLAGEKLATTGIGVTLTTLELTQVAMPREVREIYDKVNSATVQASTMLENANNHKATLIPYAQGIASEKISAANTGKSQAVADANKALTEFWGTLEEYRLNPEVVRTRIYSAKITEFLESVGQIRVVQEGETKIILTP